MKEVLFRHNVAMRQQVTLLLDTVSRKNVSTMLILYKNWLIGELREMKDQIDCNLLLLEKNNPDLNRDVLSDTELLSQQLGFFNASFVPPIHRSIDDDILGLKLLEWLHQSHPPTANIPFAISDGSFSIYPARPTLYYLPIVEQKGLLFLALFFHEFGHLLFAIHRPEMEKLIEEIQNAVGESLRPVIVHNDEKNDQEWRKNEAIVTTWYKWSLELFCDAVGLIIGGESFLYAFSSYFQMGGRDAFFMPEEDMMGHSHPVTAIRIKFLIKRAHAMGYTNAAERVLSEWELIRSNYGVSEEYFGFFINDNTEVIEKVIDDMLVEAYPTSYNLSQNSPVHILNEAWRRFFEDPEAYPAWEREQVTLFVQSIYSTPEPA